MIKITSPKEIKWKKVESDELVVDIINSINDGLNSINDGLNELLKLPVGGLRINVSGVDKLSFAQLELIKFAFKEFGWTLLHRLTMKDDKIEYVFTLNAIQYDQLR